MYEQFSNFNGYNPYQQRAMPQPIQSISKACYYDSLRGTTADRKY